MIETWLNLFGLLLTSLDAFVAARSVIISKEQAKSLGATYWNGNEALAHEGQGGACLPRALPRPREQGTRAVPGNADSGAP
jgi:hypothetical protein